MCVDSMQILGKLTLGTAASLIWVPMEAPAASLLCVPKGDYVFIKYLLDSVMFPLSAALVPKALQGLTTQKFHSSTQTTGPFCQLAEMVKYCLIMKCAG